MNKLIICAAVVIVIVCAVVVFLSLQYTPPSAAGYKISGYVKSGGTALSGATVTLGGSTTTTDANGYYEFTGLTGNNSYALSISKTGYESYSGTVQLGTEDKVVSEITLKSTEVAMPLTEIKSALATMESVSADNVEIYFCVLADESDNYAAGAVINERDSVVFIYTQSTGGIVEENNYAPTTPDGIAGMDIVVTKQPISRWTGYKIVPSDFVQKGAAYSFNFYDGYDSILKMWGFGIANINAAGNIPDENMSHTWIA